VSTKPSRLIAPAYPTLHAAAKSCSLSIAALSRGEPKSRRVMAGSESAIGGRTSSDPLFGPLRSWSFRALPREEQPLLAQTGPLIQINGNDGPAIQFVDRYELKPFDRAAPAPVLADAQREEVPC